MITGFRRDSSHPENALPAGRAWWLRAAAAGTSLAAAEVQLTP